MKGVKRFSISLEEELLKSIDAIVRGNSFPNRSQAIRFLIRDNLVTENWKEDKQVAGCIVLVYDHHKRELLNKSINIQHKYQAFVLSVQHVHLDHHNCLEALILKGKASHIKELADKLISLKGMKHGQLIMSGMGLQERR